jgi:hypothetical protein
MLLSMILAAPLAAGEGKARVITSVERAVQCIASISVYEVDGQLANMNSMGFDLEPGRHTMQGRATINSQNCPAMRGNESRDVPPLEHDFEAGKTYYVGLDHSSRNRAEWRYVVWKVEDAK